MTFRLLLFLFCELQINLCTWLTCFLENTTGEEGQGLKHVPYCSHLRFVVWRWYTDVETATLSCHHHVILCQRCSCTVLSQHRSEAGSSRAVSTLGRCSCLLQWSWTGALGTRKAPETFRLQAFRAQLTASRAPAFLSLRRPRTQFVHDMIPSLLRLMIMFSLTNWAFVWARWLPYLY